MKANPFHCLRTVTRSGTLVSCICISAATSLIFAAADPADPANPESKPLKDQSPAKAGGDSTPVEDTSKASGKDSRPVVDDDRRANERSQEESGDSSRVDDGSGKANPESAPVEDEREASGADSRKVDDANPRKASPEARRTTDHSHKASPKAGTVNDADDRKANPDSRTTSSAARARDAEPEPPVPEEPSDFESETAVREAMTDAEASVRQSKLQIRRPEEARGILQRVLGAEGTVSRAEEERDDAMAEAADKTAAEVPRRMRMEVKDYLRDRLMGRPPAGREAPAFFRDRREDGTPALIPLEEPRRFFHSGRRYVSFHSKTSIPAVLLAHASLGSLELQAAAEAAGALAAVREPLMALPVEYRDADAWIISYPVSKESMISSGDILFRPGSTRFADTHAYGMVEALAEAMKDPDLAGERFIIEGHASAEGSFEENQILSQQRAETIAREIVRNGVPAEQVIPVGYGESEARHPADAPEEVRSEDRRVVVFKLDDTDAQR